MPNERQIARKRGAAGTSGILEVLANIPLEKNDSVESDLVLDLPLPPSINRTAGSKLGNRHPLVKDWRRDATNYLMATGQSRRLRLLEGEICAEIIWNTQNLADIDNRIKHLLDYLQLLGVVTNDNKVRSMHLDYGVTPAGCHVSLRQTDRLR